MKNGSNTAIRSETAIVMIDVFVIGITLLAFIICIFATKSMIRR
nr:MAG TPA: hypothetical protein [Caudoviricetes sp.]DAP42702.1 MAG TPA: hypothetical protein [Caudoviricetes sp.]DAR32754.1 MAG TPA: hypothetical protein [Caudoviricetes sp.]DAU61867.1 MAG TPA: hypothetical protein [Caudoviricetes sp.]DAW98890.1 MAG TPA: hypothetical protein [Bacteriophage sp.]